MGQLCVLHGCISVNAGQIAPPFAALCSMARVRILTPLPHGRVQMVQTDPSRLCAIQSLTAQSIGHGALLHALVADKGGHDVPAPDGSTSTVRERVDMPVPQLLSHGDH